MFIHEAVLARSATKPFIRRRAWGYLTDRPESAVVKIQPTNTPDCCIIMSAIRKEPCRGWQPTAEDLVADDWEPVL